jgi:SAM-dependent methyltransferase
MPFRATFDCLWCGAAHATRTPDDIEGWAQLCPTCIGKAGDNGFLRFRLRQAITERGQPGSTHMATDTDAAVPPADPVATATISAPHRPAPDDDTAAGEMDDWLLRRGRFAKGAIHDTAWHAELDAAGRWLDTQPLRGEIVDLAAGTGWWATLLADKGELSLYDVNAAALEHARERLVAHGLRAHLHPRDPWSEPDRAVDAVVLGFALAGIPANRLPAYLAIVGRWLKPSGRLAIIDPLADPAAPLVVGVAHDPAALEVALRDSGFVDIALTTTGRFFVMASARRGGGDPTASGSSR